MANKEALEMQKECSKQSDNLFAFLGKFLFDNISLNLVAYSFQPPDEVLKARAEALLKDIAEENKKKLAPSKAAVLIKKNKIKAVLQGAKNVFLKKKWDYSLGIERRGQLEPYTKLIVDLHIFSNKLQEVGKDLEDSLSPGLLYADSDRFLGCKQAIDRKISVIISLLEENKEVIKSIMKKKRSFLEANPKALFWKVEDDFLKQAAGKVSLATERIDRLIVDVAGIFKDIKRLYDKGLQAESVVLQEEPLLIPDDVGQGEPEDAGASNQEEAVQQEEESGEEVGDEEAGVEEVGGEETDYGLLETALRKLNSEVLDGEEKLVVLNAIFRNVSKRTIPFLYELIKSADIFLRKQLILLLASLDYPEMIGLYRRFIADDESALRLHGIMGLVKLKSEEAQHVLVSAINDKDLNVRRFIVNCLKHTGTETEVAAIARMANDPSQTVALIAIRKLGLMSNRFAFVNLVQKLDSLDINIRKEAILALRAITKTDLGYDYAASDLERVRMVQQWKVLVAQSYSNPRIIHELRIKQAVSSFKRKKSDVKNKIKEKR